MGRSHTAWYVDSKSVGPQVVDSSLDASPGKRCEISSFSFSWILSRRHVLGWIAYRVEFGGKVCAGEQHEMHTL
jgi:hypothetical protein